MKLKKGPKRVLLIILLVLIVSTVGFVVYYFNFREGNVKEVKVLNEIKGYGYKLKDNKSKQYKELFYELEKILKKDNVNEKDYVKTISKMFIYDFYTLDDKTAKTDVGGVDFLYSEISTNFLDKAEDTLYKYVENNLYGQRKQKNLPVVKSVKIESVEEEEFEYGEQTDEKAYKVTASWTYTESSEKGYQNKAVLIFVHNDKRLDLVEIQNSK